MRTVTPEEFLKLTHELLDEYVHLHSVSIEDEQYYLEIFQKRVAEMKRVYGKRSVCTIVKPEEFRTFCTLPNSLRIYRGYYEPDKRDGISWSLSRKVAEGFAYVGSRKHLPPMVVTGRCRLSQVLAYTNAREEQEVVIAPKDVRNIANIRLRAKPSFPVSAESLAWLLHNRQHHGSEVIK